MDPDHPIRDDPPSDVLDAQALARLGQLDPTGRNGLVRRVLVTYSGSLVRLRQQIEDSSDSADVARLRLGAHTLKSSSASVGALELSRLCAGVEQAARDAWSPELPGMVARLIVEIDRVDIAVRHLTNP